MRIKLLTDLADAVGVRRRGSSLDLDDADAARLIAAGSAEPYAFDARLLATAATAPQPNHQPKGGKR